MDYFSRPAFRNDWFQILLVIAFVAGAGACVAGIFPGLQPELWMPSAVGLAGVSAVIALGLIFQHFQWRFSISNGTIESSKGLIGRDVRSIRVQDLRNVNVRQSLWQRVLGVGNVEFSSAGGEGIEVTFHGVASPMRVKEMVQSAQ